MTEPANPMTDRDERFVATDPAVPPRGWGLHPEPGARYHWSARTILEQERVDILWDRQGIEGTGTPEELKTLVDWINTKALPVLQASDLPASDSDATLTIEGDGFRMRYNPRGSCGYIYISAAPAPEVTTPTPKPKPKPKPRRRKTVRRRPTW